MFFLISIKTNLTAAGWTITRKLVLVFLDMGKSMDLILRFIKFRPVAFLRVFFPTTTVTGLIPSIIGLVLTVKYTLNREFGSAFPAAPYKHAPSTRRTTTLQKTVSSATFPFFGLIGSFWHF